MKIVHMKRDPADKGKQSAASMDKPNSYHHGLTLVLDKESLRKLGIDKMEVGSEHMISGHVKVTGMHEHADERGSSGSHTLQITHMGLEPKGKKPLKDAPMDEYASRRKGGEKA
jgi:hypothetical protein